MDESRPTELLLRDATASVLVQCRVPRASSGGGSAANGITEGELGFAFSLWGREVFCLRLDVGENGGEWSEWERIAGEERGLCV